MKIIMKLLAFFFAPDIPQEIAHIERNIKSAPVCCDKPMKYVGEHSGHFLKTQFYQCQECKRVGILHRHDWEK